jgi:putative flippase GtrA
MMAPARHAGLRRHGGRLLRFIAVGGAFSLIYAVTTALLVGLAGAPALPTSILVYAACVPLAFALQKRVTFRNAETRRGGFLAYAAVQVASVSLVSFVTTRFVTGDMARDTLVFLVTSGAAAVLSYAVTNAVSFRTGA